MRDLVIGMLLGFVLGVSVGYAIREFAAIRQEIKDLNDIRSIEAMLK